MNRYICVDAFPISKDDKEIFSKLELRPCIIFVDKIIAVREYEKESCLVNFIDGSEYLVGKSINDVKNLLGMDKANCNYHVSYQDD